MANIKSAKKRIKVSSRRKEENRGKKSELNSSIKKFRAMVTRKEFAEATAFLPSLVSLIDSAASHNRLHKKAADRKKARLSEFLFKAQQEGTVVAPVKEEKVAKVAPAKEEVVEVKEEVKEAPAKKAPAKKAPAKKPAAKKEAVEEKAPAKKAPAKKTTTAKTTTTAKKAPAKKPAAKKEEA